MNKSKYLFLSFLFFALFSFYFRADSAAVALAQGASTNISQKDSDYDGLTDKAEQETYRTDQLRADTDQDGFLDASEVLAGTDPRNPQSPIEAISGSGSAPASQSVINATPWYISRAAAIASIVLMFLVVVLGAGLTTSYAYKVFNPVRAWLIHKYLSIALAVTLGVHIFSLLFDKFIKLSLGDILIPFNADLKPLYLGIGIMGFYMFLIIMLTSIFLRIRMPRFWRATHYLVYPLFAFSLAHGFLIGTDSNQAYMQAIYGVFGTLFVCLLVYRFLLYRRLKKV